jgi:phosphoglycerol transferase MdoB-like AlkP superfamily enzyme
MEFKMNTFDKIRAFCRPFRIVIGLVLIAIGYFTANEWFYLGVIPLVAGLMDFCPLCSVSGKCTPKFKK